jgi:hypothetical protein
MVRKPSTSSKGSPIGPTAKAGPGKTQPQSATTEQDALGGATADDSVFAGSADPWAETDAGHPDENAADSPDQHPQSDDETKNPGT